EVEEELVWWLKWLRGWNGSAVVPIPADIDLFSDASNTGYGGFMLRKGKQCRQVVQGHWNFQEQEKSTNYRELVAAERVLKAFLKWENIRGCTVRLFTDNIVTYTYLNKMGGKVNHLKTIALEALQSCERAEVLLTVEHLPGVQNQLA